MPTLLCVTCGLFNKSYETNPKRLRQIVWANEPLKCTVWVQCTVSCDSVSAVYSVMWQWECSVQCYVTVCVQCTVSCDSVSAVYRVMWQCQCNVQCYVTVWVQCSVSCDSVSAVYSVMWQCECSVQCHVTVWVQCTELFLFIYIFCSMPRYRVILHELRHLILNLQESFKAELSSSENKFYYNIVSSIYCVEPTYVGSIYLNKKSHYGFQQCHVTVWVQCTVLCDSVSAVYSVMWQCECSVQCRVTVSVQCTVSFFFNISIYCSMPRYRVILHALRHLILNLQESFTAMSYLVVKISCIII